VGEELERVGMSSSRNRDQVEFTFVANMWTLTGIRSEWDKFERGHARRMFSTAAGVCRFSVSFIQSGAVLTRTGSDRRS